MVRFLVALYGALAYLVGMGGLALFMLYVGGWEFLPFHVDSEASQPLGVALAINAGLMLLLGIQHSVMARQGFKRVWTKVIPAAIERSTYVLLSGLVFALLCYFWEPVSGTLWQIQTPGVRTLLTGLHLAGWALVVLSSFVINHFELFGLQQVYYYFTGKPVPTPQFTERLLYRVVRHPLQLGVLMGLWFAATMSMTHLLLSSAMTVYILLGLYWEEKDLVAKLGPAYQAYQQRVPMLLPLPGWRAR
jgi:protein-S-isoprenylcysteine O-methyltransferase Ste14